MLEDKYARAIAYLTEHPDEILDAWRDGPISRLLIAHPGACLFSDTGPYEEAGCLTQVRNEGYNAATPGLTAAIRADERIPKRPDLVTVADLPVLAQWQRVLDAELGEDRLGPVRQSEES